MIYYQHKQASLEAATLTLQTNLYHQVDGNFDNLGLRHRDGEWTVRNTMRIATSMDRDAMKRRINRLLKHCTCHRDSARDCEAHKPTSF